MFGIFIIVALIVLACSLVYESGADWEKELKDLEE